MTRKLDGTFIQSGTITVNQLAGGLNDTSNASYAQANAAYSQANAATTVGQNAYAQANLAYTAANNSNLLSGGLVSGTINVTQDLIVGGNIYLEGNTTYINVSTYSIEDSLVYYASNNKLTDSVDIGFMGGKNTSSVYSHTGLARDATDGKWKLFDGLPEEGHVGNVINFANTYLATLVANVEANTLSVVNGVSGNVNFDSGTLFIDSVGNRVGIGTTNPVANLTISNAGASGLEFIHSGAIGDGPYIQAYNRSTSAYMHLTNYALSHTWYVSGTRAIDLASNGNVGIGTTTPTAKLDIGSGNLAFSNTAQRITADMSNATVSNRFAFQTSTANGNTQVNSIPNGNATAAQFIAYNSSDPNNASSIQMAALSTATRLLSGQTGTGTYLPLTFFTNGSEQARIDTSGNLGIGTTTPRGNLDVGTATASAITRSIHLGYSAADFYGFRLTNFNTAASFGAGNFLIQRGTTAAWVDDFAIDNNGNVGIGTTSPTNTAGFSRQLQIQGTTAALTLSGTTGTGKYTLGVPGTNALGLWDNTASAYRWYVDSSGNLGIGTTSPSNKLHVAGTTRSTFFYGLADAANDSAEFGNTQSNLRIGGDGATIRMNAAPWNLTIIAPSVIVNGALSKSSGSFKIDHPLPEKSNTHYLVHSFIEGPQADLIYRGKANLVNGIVTVNIDTAARMTEGTFVLLCRDVQCFTSNETDWDAVRGSVTGNILTIQCQNPESNATISWMVIGERQDKHMIDTGWTDEDGKVIVEPEKPIVVTPEEINVS
jgi:hypothetical protein